MDNDRKRRLIEGEENSLTQYDLDNGWLFCCALGDKLINRSDPEFKGCHCHYRKSNDESNTESES